MSTSKATAPAHCAGCGAQTKRVLLQFDHLLDDFARTVSVADSPAGHRIGFRKAVDHQRLWIELGGRDERLVVIEQAVDFVADQNDVCAAASSARPRISSRLAVTPVGLAGLLNRIALVRGVILSATRSTSNAEVRMRVHQHATAPHQTDQRRVHDEVRIEHDHFVARVDQRQHRQHQPAAGAAGDEHLPVRVLYWASMRALQFLPQHGHALRQRVAVAAGSYRADHFVLNLIGTGKSGCPIDKLIGFFIVAARSNTLRMPELSKYLVRSAIQRCMGANA